MNQTQTIDVTVNGTTYRRDVPVRLKLADFLREELCLTGTHLGCEQGACGACTVLLDGEAVRSCLLLAVQTAGSAVTTIEGLAPTGDLTPLMQALQQHHGLQCGFCTPGVVISLTSYLERNPNPTEAEVRQALTGTLCRCTGYQGIVAAALSLVQGKAR